MTRITLTWILGTAATAAIAFAAYKVWQRRQYSEIIEEGSFTIKVKK